MKITTFIIFAVILQVSAAGFAQKVTLSSNNSRLTEVFNEIRNQTGYDFLFTSETLKDAKRVSIKVENAELKDVLNQLFINQPLEYIINKKAVIVSKKEEPSFLDRVVDAFTPPIDVRGTVVDEKGMPLPGVTVSVKGTNKATSTDNSGKFYLPGVDDKAILEFRIIGYKTLQYAANGKFEGIRMEMVSKGLEEVVVAYGKTTQKAMTGSLTIVQGEQIQTLPNRSFDKSLEGLVPGMLITSGSGQPGSGVSNFLLRGIGTAGDPTLDNFAARSPLIVIDGIPVTQDNYQWPGDQSAAPTINPLAQINTADIESISVLKDAAAIALYGSKASNGVIMVTTKKGKSGKTMINFSSQADISKRLKGKINLVNQQEYLELLSEAYMNYDVVKYPGSDAVITEMKTLFPVRLDGSLYPFSDWENEVFTKSALTSTNQLSVSGGNDRSTFYLSLGYTKQNGGVKKTSYDQKSIRFNFDNRPKSWLSLGLNSAVSHNIQHYGSLSGDFPNGTAKLTAPLNPVRLEDGAYFLNFAYPYQDANPVAANDYNTNRNTSFRGLNTLSAQAQFLKNFSFSSSLGVDFMLLEAYERRDPRLYDASTSSVGIGRLQERNTRNLNLIVNNALRFAKTIEKHSINAFASMESQVLNSKFIEGTGRNFSFPDADQLQGTLGRDATGNTLKQTLVSYLGQINYGYKDKYFLSTSIRADGSSNFGERNRFGTFWSVGLGWVVSDENFMKNLAGSWLDLFKVRGSVGASGNASAIKKNTRYDEIFNGVYLNNPGLFPGTVPSNPDIAWEHSFNKNLGIDIKALNSRVSISGDIYIRKTYDLIQGIVLPFITGYRGVGDNIGDIKNSGIEISVGLDPIRDKNFQWKLNANWSANKNILLKANLPSASISSAPILRNEIGKPMNVYYLKKWAGVNSEDGAPQWLDVNGKPTSDFFAAKEEYVGKPQPDGFGGLVNTFVYKNFSLEARFVYQYGFQTYNQSAMNLISDGSNPFTNQDKAALDRWRKPGDMAANPKRQLYNYTGLNNSTRFLEDGDFLRFQTLQLSYNFSKKALARLDLNGLSLYIQAYNLATWTKFPGGDISGIDPSGSSRLTYPNERKYSLGLNLSF